MHRLADGGLSAIAAGCGQLQVLRVNSCARITDTSVCQFARAPSASAAALQSLTELDLKFAEITDSGLWALLHGTTQVPLQVWTHPRPYPHPSRPNGTALPPALVRMSRRAAFGGCACVC
jgi:hypothetical protein